MLSSEKGYCASLQHAMHEANRTSKNRVCFLEDPCPFQVGLQGFGIGDAYKEAWTPFAAPFSWGARDGQPFLHSKSCTPSIRFRTLHRGRTGSALDWFGRQRSSRWLKRCQAAPAPFLEHIKNQSPGERRGV